MTGHWIKRKVFKFRFKGRRARGLLWRKSVYEEWFEYAKISPLSYPKEFGDLSSFKNFEEWWRDPEYGFELFCEPVEKPLVEEISDLNNVDLDNDYVYLKVDLNSDFDVCMARLKTLLRNKRKSLKPRKFESMAKFKPSKEMKRIHVDTLKRQRKAWELKQNGLKRYEVVEALNYNHKNKDGDDIDIDNLLRVVSRDVERANNVFKNISKGSFP